MIKVLAAFDKCKDSLAAKDACNLVKRTLEASSSKYQVEVVPMTDGGEGFVEILTREVEGNFMTFTIKDSLGREKSAPIGVCEVEKLGETAKSFLNLPKDGKIGIIEMATAVGLADLRLEERNPWKTSTLGVGELLVASSKLDLDGIVLGIGGSSTNDLGLGALVGLGLQAMTNDGQFIRFPCPDSWASISEINANEMLLLPPLFIACDVKNPLLGANGATFQFGRQKGLSSSDLEILELGMKKMVTLLKKNYPKAEAISKVEGSGAAGGIAFGLSLAYDVRLVPGFDLVSSWFDLDDKIKKCEFLITGEGRFDQTSMLGKAPYALITRACNFGKKAYLLAGSIDQETRKICSRDLPGVEIHAFGKSEVDLMQNLAKAPKFLKKKLKEIFLTS